MPKKIEYAPGHVSGGVSFLREHKHQKGVARTFDVVCLSCGEEIVVYSCNYIKGIGSCRPCAIKKDNYGGTTHGMSKTPIYYVWFGLKSRCYNKNRSDYSYYGGRGISVYTPWISDFELFFDYASSLPHYGDDGYSLDRIDNDGNYEPGNLRWATKHIQNTNQQIRRDSKTGYVGVTYHPRGYFATRICVEGVVFHIGEYKEMEDAVNARNDFILEKGLSEYKLQTWRG